MNSKEIGFLFRIALSCALDSTKSIHLGEPDTVSKSSANAGATKINKHNRIAVIVFINTPNILQNM